jgi:hypothetical protein
MSTLILPEFRVSQRKMVKIFKLSLEINENIQVFPYSFQWKSYLTHTHFIKLKLLFFFYLIRLLNIRTMPTSYLFSLKGT